MVVRSTMSARDICKGKGYCEYVGWRKETIERVAAIKLRNAFLRLTMGQNLRDEISLYHADQNKHTVSKIHTLESEITYLQNRIVTLRQEISSGIPKPYHSDMLLDFDDELQLKEQLQTQLSSQVVQPDIQESQVDTVKQDFHLIINLLDSDGANPQLLNQMLGKYLSRVLVQREFQINLSGETVYEKTIVADLNFTIS